MIARISPLKEGGTGKARMDDNKWLRSRAFSVKVRATLMGLHRR